MRKTFLTITITIFILHSAFSQTNEYNAPSYPQGKGAYRNYVKRNMYYPRPCYERSEQGEVKATVYVAATGKIKKVTIAGNNDEMNYVAKSALKGMPDWIPGKLNGHPIDTLFTQIIYFSLNDMRAPDNDSIIEIMDYKVSYVQKNRPTLNIAKLYYDNGLEALKNKHYAEAVDLFNKAYDGGFENINMYYNRGVAYLNLGNKDAACRDWAEATKRGDTEAFKIAAKICERSQLDTTGVKFFTDTIGMSVGAITKPDVMPVFPGGDSTLSDYIQKHLNQDKTAGIKGRLTVFFIVDIDGHIKYPHIIPGHGLEKEANEEAIRVINELPQWTPGTKNGNPVAVKRTVEVKFK